MCIIMVSFDTNVAIFLFSAAGTDSHEFHHGVNMGIFGHKLTLWDHLFGTDKVYKQWRTKQWRAIEKV
jgi:sterol desaturase/sphingolipid hydroxylase (fatty acid hydroxylase superfamily)